MRKILVIAIVVIIASSNVAFGAGTRYVLESSFSKISCIEKNVGGSYFSRTVAIEKCRPAHTKFLFNLDEYGPICAEADVGAPEDPDGSIHRKDGTPYYFAKTDLKNCRPKETKFEKSCFYKKCGCYELGVDVPASAYAVKVADSSCKTDDSFAGRLREFIYQGQVKFYKDQQEAAGRKDGESVPNEDSGVNNSQDAQ